jgi:hypothetical protein
VTLFTTRSWPGLQANVSTADGSTGSVGARQARAIKTTGADSRLSWRTLSRALASAGTAFLGLFRQKKTLTKMGRFGDTGVSFHRVPTISLAAVSFSGLFYA